MTDIILRDIDDLLADRLKRLSEHHAWPMHETLLAVIEQGLHACESGALARFDDREANALQQAIAALQEIPDDAGFGLIGKAAAVEEDGAP